MIYLLISYIVMLVIAAICLYKNIDNKSNSSTICMLGLTAISWTLIIIGSAVITAFICKCFNLMSPLYSYLVSSCAIIGSTILAALISGIIYKLEESK